MSDDWAEQGWQFKGAGAIIEVNPACGSKPEAISAVAGAD